MYDNEQVAIFWDYENCRPPSTALGHGIVNRMLDIAHQYGGITTFKAYLDLNEPAPSKTCNIYSELQSSGVSVIHCPHNGRKDVADKMIIVDMLAFGIDKPPPATIILISGDRDFSYAVSVLRLRKYRVIVITPAGYGHESLKYQASDVIDWGCIVSEAGGSHSRNISSSGRSQPYSKARMESVSMKPEAAIDVGVEAAKSETLYRPMVDGVATALLSTTPQSEVSLPTPSTIGDSTLASSGSSPHSSRDDMHQDSCLRSSPASSVELSPPHTPRTGQSTLLPARESSTPVSDYKEDDLPSELLRRMAPFELDLFRAARRSSQRPLDNRHDPIPTRPKSCIEPIITEDAWMSDSSSYWTAKTGRTTEDGNDDDIVEARSSVIDNGEDNGANRLDMESSSMRMQTAQAQRVKGDINLPSTRTSSGTYEEQHGELHSSSAASRMGVDCDIGSSAFSLMKHNDNADITIDRSYEAYSMPDASHPPPKYQKLVEVLQEYRVNGVDRPLLSTVAHAMADDEDTILRLTGLSSFFTYARLAEADDIVELGSLEPSSGIEWISLCPAWFERSVFSSSNVKLPFQRHISSPSCLDALGETPQAQTGDGGDNPLQLHVQAAQNNMPPMTLAAASPSKAGLHPDSTTRTSSLEDDPGEAAPPSSADFVTVPTPIPIPLGFEALVRIMRELRLRGYKRPILSVVVTAMGKDKDAMLRAKGVSTMSEYAELARQAGIVETGRARVKGDWMSLLPVWHEEQSTV